MSQLVTVRTFSFQHEAHMAAHLLEEAGIKVFIKDEMIGGFYSNAVGGIKIQVVESELSQAEEILTEGGYV